MDFSLPCVHNVHSGMRIISHTKLRRFWQTPQQEDAEKPLTQWYDITNSAQWKNPAEVKASFGATVDFVRVDSQNTVAVFDIHNNKYRLVAAIHYDYPRVFVLRIMTHKQYDKNYWKGEL